MKNVIFSLVILFFGLNNIYGQNCQYGQCAYIKSDGSQCKRCVGYLESNCSSHTVAKSTYNLYQNEHPQPTNPSYNTFMPRNDCKYGQCIAIKQDGGQCRNCVSNTFDTFCSQHK